MIAKTPPSTIDFQSSFACIELAEPVNEKRRLMNEVDGDEQKVAMGGGDDDGGGAGGRFEEGLSVGAARKSQQHNTVGGCCGNAKLSGTKSRTPAILQTPANFGKLRHIYLKTEILGIKKAKRLANPCFQ